MFFVRTFCLFNLPLILLAAFFMLIDSPGLFRNFSQFLFDDLSNLAFLLILIVLEIKGMTYIKANGELRFNYTNKEGKKLLFTGPVSDQLKEKLIELETFSNTQKAYLFLTLFVIFKGIKYESGGFFPENAQWFAKAFYLVASLMMIKIWRRKAILVKLHNDATNLCNLPFEEKG